MKAEGRAELTDPVTHDAHTELPIRHRLPAFRGIRCRRRFLESLNRLFRRLRCAAIEADGRRAQANRVKKRTSGDCVLHNVFTPAPRKHHRAAPRCWVRYFAAPGCGFRMSCFFAKHSQALRTPLHPLESVVTPVLRPGERGARPVPGRSKSAHVQGRSNNPGARMRADALRSGPVAVQIVA